MLLFNEFEVCAVYEKAGMNNTLGDIVCLINGATLRSNHESLFLICQSVTPVADSEYFLLVKSIMVSVGSAMNKKSSIKMVLKLTFPLSSFAVEYWGAVAISRCKRFMPCKTRCLVHCYLIAVQCCYVNDINWNWFQWYKLVSMLIAFLLWYNAIDICFSLVSH